MNSVVNLAPAVFAVSKLLVISFSSSSGWVYPDISLIRFTFFNFGPHISLLCILSKRALMVLNPFFSLKLFCQSDCVPCGENTFSSIIKIFLTSLLLIDCRSCARNKREITSDMASISLVCALITAEKLLREIPPTFNDWFIVLRNSPKAFVNLALQSSAVKLT